MLRPEDSFVLDCIDAIDDLDKKRSAMNKLLAMASQKPSEKQLEIPKQHYSFQEVINRVQNEKAASRQPSVTKLRTEMNSYKKELQELKKQQQSHNQQLQDYDQRIQASFVFEGEALIDLGADLNCISEGIIPSQYFSKTTQMLNTANGGRMLIEAIIFAEKFPDEITDKQQLQRFLGSLIYLADFYKDLAKDAKPLFARLMKSPGSWTEACTKAVQKIKSKAKELPFLAIPHPDAFKIVETDASEYGYGGIMKQDLSGKTSLEAALPSSTKRVSADSTSSNLKRMDDGYKHTTWTLAFFIKAEHWGSDLELIAQIYLRDHLSPSIDSQKSIQWFETILMETGCARITHYYKSNKQINSRAHPSSYNFFDYVQAWNEVLNYQNISYGHSWFIKLSITTKDFSRVPIPCWFQQWLLQCGIIGDALPECVLEASNKFYQHNQKKVPIELSFLYFLVLYQVPWILRWEYQFNEDPFSLEAEKLEGIESNIDGRSIKFVFAQQPKYKEIHNLREKISRKEKFLMSLKEEIKYMSTSQKLNNPALQEKFQKQLEESVCSDVPNAFWSRQKDTACLPYVNGFDERRVSTKARPIQMNSRYLEISKKEIEELMRKGLIRKSHSLWSCPAFYVKNAAELERAVPRLVINYKPLNEALQWIRYPIPNKRDLLNRLYKACIFSKFDMKSGYWQIQIAEADKYKTAFTVPFGHYEWNVMPFGLKNAPSEFQHIMNEIFNPYMDYIIVYIDDVLVFSKSLDQHWKHLKTFIMLFSGQDWSYLPKR
ncbi:hypothetical protein ACOSQ2_010166 [Xanthoceras sorbifolium]